MIEPGNKVCLQIPLAINMFVHCKKNNFKQSVCTISYYLFEEVRNENFHSHRDYDFKHVLSSIDRRLLITNGFNGLSAIKADM